MAETAAQAPDIRPPVSPETEQSLAAVPFRVTDPERIPAQRYYDQHFFDLEKEHLWPHVWQMACRLEEIPEVGDYVEYRILDKSVIVVRTKSGVKAFHNACRHRGMQLVTEPGNCRNKGFICPFHGWRWNMEGENTFVFGKQIFSPEVLDKAEINLVPCRLETWGGCAFINFDDEAPSLLESLGPVADRLSTRNVDKMKMEWWYATVLPTNWKLAMEAFMEGYHLMRTHPQLHALQLATPFGEDHVSSPIPVRQLSGPDAVDQFIKSLEVLREGMAGQVSAREIEILHDLRATMKIPQDMGEAIGLLYTRMIEEITSRGRKDGLDVPDMAEVFKTRERGVEFMFPHFFMLPVFSAMASYRIRPLSAETCLFEIWGIDHFKDGEIETPKQPTLLPYDSPDFPEVPRQDYCNLPQQQIGLHAGGFEHMRLSSRFEGMISNYQRLIDGYLAELGSDLLAKAATIVNDGYDSPIVDIGF